MSQHIVDLDTAPPGTVLVPWRTLSLAGEWHWMAAYCGIHHQWVQTTGTTPTEALQAARNGAARVRSAIRHAIQQDR